jgi:hypothetical protein
LPAARMELGPRKTVRCKIIGETEPGMFSCVDTDE